MRKVDLRAVADAVGPPFGKQVLDGAAQLAQVAVPGVDGTVVWRVRGESGAHPWQVYVGLRPGGVGRVLTADQDAWAALMVEAGCRLHGEADASAYVEVFLEVTRGALVLVRPLTSLAEIPWRPGSADEETAKAALLAKPPAVEPRSVRTAAGFKVELTLVVDQRLQRNQFELSPAGEITRTSFQVIAENLPLPIAR